MANVARRGFLALIGAAPVALPVVAKEAAAKMGLKGVLAVGETVSHYGGEVASCAPISIEDERTWLLNEIAKLRSSEHRNDLRHYERHDARLLDGDLAALRSISPMSAYTIQRERCVDRRIEREASGYAAQLKRLAGF